MGMAACGNSDGIAVVAASIARAESQTSQKTPGGQSEAHHNSQRPESVFPGVHSNILFVMH